VAITGASYNGVFRWKAAEAALTANFSASALAGLKVDATDMISDLHGTADYRANLVKVMTGRAVTAAR
jgi:carbon-monoxide dehydrogenase medium subunit